MIETQKQDNRWRCRLSATLENIDEVDDLFTEYIKRLRTDVDVFVLRILVREALLNAVIHGCGNDPANTVDLLVETDNAGLTLMVSDPGEGFNWADHEGLPVDLCESGRGIALMKIYADSIAFNNSGNIVTLRKNYKVAQTISR
jgi:serine/threonine-protein kinase RsbW